MLSRGDIKKNLSELIGSGLFYLILAATFVLALERAGVGDIRSSAVSMLEFLPRVAGALLVGFLGALLSEIAGGVVRVTAGKESAGDVISALSNQFADEEKHR